MTRRLILAGVLLLLLAAMPSRAQPACPLPAQGQRLPAEAVPAMPTWPEWRVWADAAAARLRGADLSRARIAFIGDSITEAWHPEIFRLFYGQRGAVNLGVSGDVTQSLLWRLEHGHWPPALQPEAIILLIGTNNIGQGNRPEEVAVGIAAIIARLQQLAPRARIVLLGVLPRGPQATDPLRQPIARLNQLIQGCGDNRRVFYSEPGQLMVDAAGMLPDWVAFDRLHLTQVGYAILSTAIEGHLRLALQR